MVQRFEGVVEQYPEKWEKRCLRSCKGEIIKLDKVRGNGKTSLWNSRTRFDSIKLDKVRGNGKRCFRSC